MKRNVLKHSPKFSQPYQSPLRFLKDYSDIKKSLVVTPDKLKAFYAAKFTFVFNSQQKVCNRIKDRATWNPSKAKFYMLGKYLYKKLYQSTTKAEAGKPLNATVHDTVQGCTVHTA